MPGALHGRMGCPLNSLEIGSADNPLESGKISLVSSEENYGFFGDGQRYLMSRGRIFVIALVYQESWGFVRNVL